MVPADLAVTVVWPTVDLQLAFEPPSLEVATGSTATAVLRLPGVPEGARVTVELSVASTATARLVTPESVVFDADTSSREVTVGGVTVGNETLTAELVSFDRLSEDSTVQSAQLPVTVVPPPVHFQLAFDSPTLTVVVDDRKTVLFRLLAEVPEDATFDLGDIAFAAEVSSADEGIARALTRSLLFNGDRSETELTIEGVAEGSVTITVVFVGTNAASGEFRLAAGFDRGGCAVAGDGRAGAG